MEILSFPLFLPSTRPLTRRNPFHCSALSRRSTAGARPIDRRSRLLSRLQGCDIHGRIYVNEQETNAQISSAVSGHAYPRLKLRGKSSLVQWNEHYVRGTYPPTSNASICMLCSS
ncbi:hypothetical protein MRB53_023917 [Persea americana]|uniref:Uncharacterized protein n=1 Tax=Persea americana TaxID=3435 RepID=A0ACC2LAT9_PERAE|nr:hypothetical protein MRB53_023917 [Persea americana]